MTHKTETVDITPTWSGIVPALLIMLKSDSHAAREVAEAEMHRMARLADKMIAHLKTLENQ